MSQMPDSRLAGYEWLVDLIRFPPSVEDLDQIGFSMVECNKILSDLARPPHEFQEALLAALLVSNRLLHNILAKPFYSFIQSHIVPEGASHRQEYLHPVAQDNDCADSSHNKEYHISYVA